MRLRIDTRKLQKHLKERLPRDLRIATVMALTATAKTAREMLPQGLDEDFIIRSRWLTGSFRHTGARLSQGAHPFSLVGTISPLLEPHVEGGKRAGGKHGSMVGVPQVGTGLARARPESTTRPARWPGRVLAGKRSFAIKFPDGNIGIYRRIGKRKRSKLRLVWVLRDEVRVKKRWRFEEQVQTVVRHFLADHFQTAIMHRVWRSRQPR